MGGLAFSVGPDALYTPRMPPKVYHKMKYRCYDVLSELFEVVTCPIDGPNKPDYGDIDILVHGPKFTGATTERIIEKTERALGAKRLIIDEDKKISVHFAVPWPAECRELSPHEEATQRDAKMLKPEGKMTVDEFFDSCKRFVQIDVMVYNVLHELRWTLFKHAHGDIWTIIGSVIRPYGLTVDECALWVRVPEIEVTDRKRSRVFLTSDPNEILLFLDLPPNLYWQGTFPDLNTMYEYIARCRMFWVKPEDAATTAARNAAERMNLRAKERRRLNTRPAFRRWVSDFLPACRAQGKFLSQLVTREDVLEEACEQFGVGPQYRKRRLEFLIERQRDYIWKDIIKAGNPRPEDHDPIALTNRNCMIKALRRVLFEDDDGYGVTAGPELKDEDGLFIIEKVQQFIDDNKEEIGKIAVKNHMDNYAELKRREAENEEGLGIPLVYRPASM